MKILDVVLLSFRWRSRNVSDGDPAQFSESKFFPSCDPGLTDLDGGKEKGGPKAALIRWHLAMIRA